MSMAELIAQGPPPYAPVTRSAQVSQQNTSTGAGASTDFVPEVKGSPSDHDIWLYVAKPSKTGGAHLCIH